MLIDIHTHVQQFNKEDLDLLIHNSKIANVGIIIAAGTTISDSEKSISLSKKYEEIYAAVGIHPQNILDENTNNYLEKLTKLIEHPKTIMISEIGIDIQKESPELSLQKDFFYNQILIAEEYNLPIAFHVRNGEKEALEIIKSANIKNIKSVAHYFLGNYDYAKRLLNENVYISVAKPFLRDEELSEVIKKLPLDQIVIETDSYPQYFKKNRQRWTEPKDLLLIIEKLSKLKNTDPEYITEQIEKNSKNILDL
ncbi:MAG: TatD family deoxyribonuclease [SAR202 cluster bacterium]|nr:TatD family deoxyribonuclease [SAR202 cluster bacterium]|tara:strand:+ start:45 stop:803 length:759 start_codon:yes stop_codon:yes gene_type:complete